MSADTQRLGKYRVLEHVARGPLADVLRARLDGLAGFSRLYALKHVHTELSALPQAVVRIEAEARRAAALSHGNIVQVLDLGRDDHHRPYLVLEWVEGWSLAHVLERAAAAQTPVPVPQAAWIGVQILKALEYAHGRSAEAGAPMVHGALCPDNVLLGRAGDVKVADFGLGLAASELARELPDLVPARLDRSSPEQLVDAPLVPASDLFGVATVLYACLALRPPFAGESPGEAILDGRFTPLSEAAPGVPPAFAEVVDAALAADPALRPSSATVFKHALAGLVHAQVAPQEDLAAWVKDLLGIEDTAGTGEIALHSDDGLALPVDDDVTGEAVAIPFGDVPLEDDRTTPAVPGDVARPEGPDEDGHTVVRLGAVAGAGARPDPDTGWDAPGVTVVEPEMAARIAALRAGQEASVEPEAEPVGADVARRPALAGAVLAAVACLVGIALGVVGTALLGVPEQLLVGHAVLEVRSPGTQDVAVTVDGVLVRGPRTVEPGEHAVRVEVDGAAPWTVDLTLAAGEYRLLVIDAPPKLASVAPEPSE